MSDAAKAGGSPPLLADTLEQRQQATLLAGAREKIAAGMQLTQRELNVWRKHEKQLRDRYGRGYATECPKKDYLHECGTDNKTVLEQQERLSLPWVKGHKTVNLFEMLARFHKIIAANPAAFYRAAKADKSLQEFFPDVNDEDYQSKCWEEKYYALRDDRHLREQTMLPAPAIGEIFGRIADHLRAFGEDLGKHYGKEAQEMFLESWEDCQGDVERLLALGDDNGNGSDNSAA